MAANTCTKRSHNLLLNYIKFTSAIGAAWGTIAEINWLRNPHLLLSGYAIPRPPWYCAVLDVAVKGAFGALVAPVVTPIMILYPPAFIICAVVSFAA